MHDEWVLKEKVYSEVCRGIWETGGILFRDYWFGRENSLSSAATLVSSAKSSVSLLWHTTKWPRGTHWVLSLELGEDRKTHWIRCLKPNSPKPYSAHFRESEDVATTRAGRISKISRFSRVSRQWSASPLFSRVWRFSTISRISKFSGISGKWTSMKSPFSKRPLFPNPNRAHVPRTCALMLPETCSGSLSEMIMCSLSRLGCMSFLPLGVFCCGSHDDQIDAYLLQSTLNINPCDWAENIVTKTSPACLRACRKLSGIFVV